MTRSATSEAPIMIGGCGSSGTTLLAHLLNAHPSIYCGPELYLLNKRALYGNCFPFSETAFRRRLGLGLPTTGLLDVYYLASSTCRRRQIVMTFMRDPALYGFTVERLCRLAAESRGFRDFVDAFFEVVLARTGKGRWAEKTPTNCYCIGEFLSLYPRGKYVHVVRDGRDVVASLMRRGLPPENAVRRWIHDTATGLPHRGNPRYHEVRYEELVTSPETALAELMAFAGEETEPGLLLKRARSQSVLESTHGSWTLQPNDRISALSVAKWKRRNYRDKVYLEQLFRYTVLAEAVAERLGLSATYNGNDLLAEFGYDPSDQWDTASNYSARMLLHYLEERAYQLLRVRRVYFAVCRS